MQNFPGSDVYPENVRIPEDGVDPRNATIAAAGLEDLANRTKYLRERVPGLATSYIIPISPFHFVSGVADWATNAAGFPYLSAGPGSMGTADAQRVYWHLSPHLPAQGNIVGHMVLLQGASGHSWPVQYPPVLTTIRANLATIPATSTEEWDTTDTAESVAYEAAHTLFYTFGDPISISRNYDYWLALQNESGSNSMSGLKVGYAAIWVSP
jgi:hypothetical protein